MKIAVSERVRSEIVRTRPLRIAFVLTSMPVGGAETLLVDLVRSMDRARFSPEIVCLKDRGVLGETMAREVPVASQFLSHKLDLRVLPRLIRHLRQQQTDALITVGAGDKMFWGRLAAFFARVPVVASAIHSTGWPDGIGRLNRSLTSLTDAFIGVAEEHGRFLVQEEGFPASKVRVIPNGVDTHRFQRDLAEGNSIRQQLGIPLDAPVAGIVAALRPEKNHALFLQAAQQIRKQLPDCRFMIVGDGPQRGELERLARQLGLDDAVHFLGTRSDIPAVLAAMSILMLTSHNEANPVSILEALATELPVVATRVGSIPTTVIDGQTGFLANPGDVDDVTEKAVRLLDDPDLICRLGRNGRELVRRDWSLEAMVTGYQDLIEEIYDRQHARES